MPSSPNSVPSAARRHAALATPSAPPSSIRGKSLPDFAHVLIVDADAANRHVLSRWFSEHHYFVALADEHETAETMLRTIHFDLILCDATATSHRARLWIEQLMLHPPCPTIFLSAHPTLETAIRIANLPLGAYLLKPVDLNSLSRVVGRFLAHVSHYSVMAD